MSEIFPARKTEHITDRQVCQSFVDSALNGECAIDLLVASTGAPCKVALRAIERAGHRGYVEFGVSFRSGWLTESGAMLAKS